MRIKTFTGTDTKVVDQAVNDWLTANNVKVCKTSTAFQRLRDHGPDAITGKTVTRRALGIAITVWYDEPTARNAAASRPDTWVFG